jgi:anaerobic dimethyl sulfoxide reductase subunit C
MLSKDWALIAFTILAQMAVGSFVVLGVVHFFAARKSGSEQADRLSDRALLAIGPALVLGIAASFFHLGTPTNAWRAFANVGSSWLSREILFNVLFAVLGGLFAVMQWRKLGSPVVRNVLAWLAAAVGVVLVFSMSQVYALRTVPAWDTAATIVTFYTTTFLLGSLAMGSAFVANYVYIQRKNPGCADVQCMLLRDSLRWIAVVAIVLLGVEFVVVPVYVAYLAAGPVAAQESIAMLANQYSVIFLLRLVVVFLGAGVLSVFVYRNALSTGRERIMGNMAYLAFVLVLVAEVLGRFLFYAAYARVGI